MNNTTACTTPTYNETKVLENPNKPMTDLAKDRFFRVARPKSPILTEPVVPVMKILSHFKSRCIIGGLRLCKKLNPFRICRHHDFRTFGFIFLNLRKYLKDRKCFLSQTEMENSYNL